MDAIQQMPELQSIRAFLSEQTLDHFITAHRNPLVLLRKGVSTIADAMKLLGTENGILSAPLIDEEGEYLGAVSVPDILRGLVRSLDANLGEGYLDDLTTLSVEELTGLGSFFSNKPAESVLHEADLWMRGDASTTLMSVLREGFQIEQTRVHHRIYVCDPAKATHLITCPSSENGKTIAGPTVVNIVTGTEKEGASSWVPTDVVTQLDLVSLLVEKGLASVPATLEELGLARTVVSTVMESESALVAFHHMAQDHKSAVGILDAQGQLVGSLSVADLRDLPCNSFGLLLKPVRELLSSVFTRARLDVMGADTTFEGLLRHMVQHRLHRVYIAASDGGARSIITLTDVLRVVSGCSIPKARRSLDILREEDDRKRAELALREGTEDDTEEEAE
mmetsp:Transcript_4244/g.7022  ORF Transcript_4244/g.7022 Transcript_4244/m.7022 type:complete len:393 (-) Transcript_4244:651-1829(-)|eukprot:CAMPEP_0119107990 /NCGR_PEP_ID=MMETSP1180-20130426/12843_1 /TAXON_ID=3052 ORGANISM="Chlamydomonas cf sp, Strain CCMP681" /NCGR_SAMPLE_ID=MMETSP1180 /ASSEMBLY_ACC=CAM_ASM_000741 /LENGTH=392 /DNA_ID=CAMNT_0007093547 /DNA_START=52 /DNA_END=1230 /DNA_ORIENTATION=+